MRLGNLRQRARVQAVNRVDDAQGGSDRSYIDIGAVWCNVTTGQGQEFLEAKKLNTALTHLVIMRHNTIVTPKTRLVIGATVYDVDVPYDPTGRRIELHALCTEIVQ